MDAKQSTEHPGFRHRKTPFLHKMNRTPPDVVCPSYYVLSHTNGCPYQCDYCCLQLPLRKVQTPVIFSNQETMLDEVKAFLKHGQAQLVSTGESSDSLALESRAQLYDKLIPLFAHQEDGQLFPKEACHKLLLVTKSTNIRSLLLIKEKENTIVSFSLNAPEIAARYEHGTPHPYNRLAAAVTCKQAGYEVRLRIDPIVPVPDWRHIYTPLIERIRRELEPGRPLNQTRITIGTIRHNPGLRECTFTRGRDTRIFNYATSQDADDERYRVPVEQRVEIYDWFITHLQPNAHIALCKETLHVWKTLNMSPTTPRCNCTL